MDALTLLQGLAIALCSFPELHKLELRNSGELYTSLAMLSPSMRAPLLQKLYLRDVKCDARAAEELRKLAAAAPNLRRLCVVGCRSIPRPMQQRLEAARSNAALRAALQPMVGDEREMDGAA